jgi:hypothetical protein
MGVPTGLAPQPQYLPLMSQKHPSTNYSNEEAWTPQLPQQNFQGLRSQLVIGTVAGQTFSFVSDTGTTLSLLTSWSGPSTKSHTPVVGVSGVQEFPHKTPKVYVYLDKWF